MHAEQAPVGERDARADVRVQRAHDALELDRGPLGIEQAVGGTELLGVGDAVLGLLDERRRLVERAHEQLAAELLQPRGERAVAVVGADRLDAGEAHGAAVEAGGEAHDRDAGAARRRP